MASRELLLLTSFRLLLKAVSVVLALSLLVQASASPDNEGAPNLKYSLHEINWDQKDKSGDTAVHYTSIKHGCAEALELLLELGGCLSLSCVHGRACRQHQSIVGAPRIS